MIPRWFRPRAARPGAGLSPLICVCGGLLVAVLMAAGAPARAAMPAFLDDAGPIRLGYTIVRNGTTIGSHTLTFRRTGLRTVVDIELTIVVRVLGITAYSLRNTGHEEWDGDRLTTLDSRTVEDGKPYQVEARAVGDSLHITVNGISDTTAPMPPASLWRMLPADTRIVLDPIDGTPTKVSIAESADDTLTVQGRPLPVRHWIWRGEMDRDLWFDASGRLVRVLIKGTDGSDIHYILQ